MKSNSESTVLVTGGAGFIGSHLVDSLVTRNFDVVVLDDFSTGRKRNLQQHFGRSNFHLMKGDVRLEADVKKALKNVGSVFHLAAVVSPRFSMKNPQLTNNVNLSGTLNLLEESVKAHVKRFVNFSSCAVYGDPVYTPIEEDHLTRPLSPYAVSKLASEHYCRVYHETYGLETTSLRFFNIYGPRQSKGPYSSVISQFIKRLKKGKPPIIFGDGEQTRDFLYVQDAVEVTLSVLECNQCSGENINVGSGRETTINKLANILIKHFTTEKIKVQHQEPKTGDIRRSVADLTKNRRLLGYKPDIPLANGLKRLLRAEQ